MKKTFAFIAGSVLALNALAQGVSSGLVSSSLKREWKDEYCAVLKDSSIIMMNGKTELVVDVTLPGGSKVTTDGYVIRTDGTKTLLKAGECVDKDGYIKPKNDKAGSSKK